MNMALRMRAAAQLLGVLLAITPVQASELRVESTRVQRMPGSNLLRVEANVRWKNGWRNARNYDAAWIVVKLRGNPRFGWTHGKLIRANAEGAPAATCTVPTDQVGAFCSPAGTHRGDVS